MDNSGQFIFNFIFVVMAVSLYFLPSIIAIFLGKRNTAAIFVVNLFFGWTGIGWIAVMVWAVWAGEAKIRVVVDKDSTALKK